MIHIVKNLSLCFLLILCLDFAVAERNTKHQRNENDCPRKCECDFAQKIIYCRYQRLTRIPRGIPSWVKKLSVAGNDIRHISPFSFNKLRDLQDLELHGNYISKIHSSTLRNLEKLDLSGNRISELRASIFENLDNLKILRLGENKIYKLKQNVLQNLNNLVELDIHNNQLQTLEMSLFENMTEITELPLYGNKWHCDCQLKKLEKDLRRRKISHGFIICDTPFANDGQNIRDIPLTIFCGPNTDVLIGSLLGIISGLIVFTFFVFMCRKTAALMGNLEVVDKKSVDEDVPIVKVDQEDSNRTSLVSLTSEEAQRNDVMNKLEVVDKKSVDEDVPIVKVDKEDSNHTSIVPLTSEEDQRNDVMNKLLS